MKKYLLAMAGILVMLAISACHDKEDKNEVIDWQKPADHTLLMYLVGDNSLSALLENNVRNAQAALRDSVKSGSLNLVVMKDNDKSGDSFPSLYWVRTDSHNELDTVMIKRWDKEENTASTEFLAEALDLTFSRFNTTIKGLSLGSHASGWVPLNNSNQFGSSQRRAFGCDDKVKPVASIELWDLGATLRGGPKLDYLLMDCCHMGSAEVAYELRDVARYMVACPTEEEGAGMPYKQLIPALARLQSASELPQVLDYCARAYFNTYARYEAGATMAVYDLRHMDALASAYQTLITANAERLKPFKKASSQDIDAWARQFQYYGRDFSGLHNRYYFYDICAIIDWLSTADPAAAAQATDAAQRVVISKYNTAVYRGIPITQYTGMAVSLPEVLRLARRSSGYSAYFSPFDDAKLTTAYHLTAWGSLMGY